MCDILLWIYLFNAILIIMHEIDSGYWKEWELFRMKGGITFFLLLHIPLLFIVLYGLILVNEKTLVGLIVALFLALCGIGAFCIHHYFLHKGRSEFSTILSRFILTMTGLISIVQFIIIVLLWID